MLIPKPTSAKLLARRMLARNIGAGANLYAAVLSSMEHKADLDTRTEREQQNRDVKERRDYRAAFLKYMVSGHGSRDTSGTGIGGVQSFKATESSRGSANEGTT